MASTSRPALAATPDLPIIVPTPSSTAGWNTTSLGPRLLVDVAVGLGAGSAVAPIIATIDRAIMENASGALSLAASLRVSLHTLLSAPHKLVFSRPCRLIAMLYGGTYCTANMIDTATATTAGCPASTVTAGPAKFFASSTANVGLTMYKDHVFMRLFGPPGAAPRAVPLASSALFAMRDSMTTFASFIVPPRLAPYLADRMPPVLSGQTVAQFVAPAAVQILSAPLHLLGLDLYNRPAGAGDRLAAICRNWSVTAAARIARIVPAYGVGGVVNTKARKYLMGRFE